MGAGLRFAAESPRPPPGTIVVGKGWWDGAGGARWDLGCSPSYWSLWEVEDESGSMQWGVLHCYMEGQGHSPAHSVSRGGGIACFFGFPMNSGRSAFFSIGKQDHSPTIETLKSHLCIGRAGRGGVQNWRWVDRHMEEEVLFLESARLDL